MSAITFIAGLKYMLIGRVDSDGFNMGQAADPDSPTVNQTYPAYLVTHPVDYTAPSVSRQTATDKGGQRFRGKRDLGVNEVGDGAITVSDYDMTLDVIATGGGIDTSYVSGWTQGAPNLNTDDLKQVWIAFIEPSQSRDDATYGDNNYRVKFYPSVQLSPEDADANQNGGTNPNSVAYNFTPQVVNKLMNGITFDLLDVDYTNDENHFHNIIPQNPIMVETFVANGAATTFTLQYKPLYNTANNAGRNWITKNGANASVSSVNVSTGVVTLSAPGDSGDIWVIIYETAFEPTS
jgi:hypothetical protein